MQSFVFPHGVKLFCTLFAGILFASFHSSAQNEKIDSLKKVLPALRDTSRIDCLNQLTYRYIQEGQKDSARRYNDLTYDAARKEQYVHGIAVSLSLKAQIAKHFDDDFAKCDTFGKEALGWYEKTNNKEGIDNLYFYLYYTAFSQSEFEEAFNYTLKRYEYARKNHNEAGTVTALADIFAIYRQSGNYEKAFSYAQQVYQLALQSRDKIEIANALYGMAQLYELIEDYPEALRYFRQVWNMYDPAVRNDFVSGDIDIWLKMEFTEAFAHQLRFDSAWYYYNLFKPDADRDVYMRVWLVSTGECYLLQRNYSRALENLQLGLIKHQSLNDRNEVMRALLDIGKAYLGLNRNREALQYGRQGLSIALATKAKQYIRDGYFILTTVYDNLSWHDSANLYFRKYINTKEEVLNDQTKATFAAFDYKQKIALLDRERAIHQEILKQKSLVTKALAAGIGVLILLSLVVIRYFMLRRKNEAHRRELAENELQIERLEKEKRVAELQQKATELEIQVLRAQMSPHFIFNSLNSINRFILQNNRLKASEYLTKFSRLVRLILQNSQAPAVSLEHELEALELYLVLETLRFDDHFTYAIQVADDVDTLMVRVPPLIIQPYVENAIWHGLMHKEEKGHIEIDIFQEEEVLFCRILDDGVGRKKSTDLKNETTVKYTSIGMSITANRIALLQSDKNEGSHVVVNDLVAPDGSGIGTEVILKIPLHYD